MRYRALLLVAAMLGCAKTNSPSAKEATTEGAVASGAEQASCCTRCPLALPGTKLSYAESSGGGSMLFSAPESELEELRARVKEMADFHNRQPQKLAMMTMAHDTRSVVTDDGARLEFTTLAGNDLP